MELGLIGLEEMGGKMAERLRRSGYKVVGFDFCGDAIQKLTDADSTSVRLVQKMAGHLMALSKAVGIVKNSMVTQ